MNDTSLIESSAPPPASAGAQSGVTLHSVMHRHAGLRAEGVGLPRLLVTVGELPPLTRSLLDHMLEKAQWRVTRVCVEGAEPHAGLMGWAARLDELSLWAAEVRRAAALAAAKANLEDSAGDSSSDGPSVRGDADTPAASVEDTSTPQDQPDAAAADESITVPAAQYQTLKELVWVQLDALQAQAMFEREASAEFEPDMAWVETSVADALPAVLRACGRRALVLAPAQGADWREKLPQALVAKAPRGRAPAPAPRRIWRVGGEAPIKPGDWGLARDGGMSWLAYVAEPDAPPATGRRRAEEEEQREILRLMPAELVSGVTAQTSPQAGEADDEAQARQRVEAALWALALATAAGCPLAPLLQALRGWAAQSSVRARADADEERVS